MLVNECSVLSVYCSPGHFPKADGGVLRIPEFIQSVLLVMFANSLLKTR